MYFIKGSRRPSVSSLQSQSSLKSCSSQRSQSQGGKHYMKSVCSVPGVCNSFSSVDVYPLHAQTSNPERISTPNHYSGRKKTVIFNVFSSFLKKLIIFIIGDVLDSFIGSKPISSASSLSKMTPVNIISNRLNQFLAKSIAYNKTICLVVV